MFDTSVWRNRLIGHFSISKPMPRCELRTLRPLSGIADGFFGRYGKWPITEVADVGVDKETTSPYSTGALRPCHDLRQESDELGKPGFDSVYPHAITIVPDRSVYTKPHSIGPQNATVAPLLLANRPGPSQFYPSEGLRQWDRLPATPFRGSHHRL